MRSVYKEWVSDVFVKANKEQIKLIGFAIFGSKLSYLESEKKQLLIDFKTEYGIDDETYADRLILKYIVNYVELHGTNSTVKTSSGLLIEKEVPHEELTLDEILIKVQRIREQ